MDDKSNPHYDINNTTKKIEKTNNGSKSSSRNVTNNEQIDIIKTNVTLSINNTTKAKTNTTISSSSSSSSSSSLFQQPTEKRNLGRSARKRKAKLRSTHQEIEQLLQQQGSTSSSSTLNDDDTTKHQSQQQHADRTQTLPGVLIRRKEEEISSSSSFSSDHMHLTSQLGFIPGNAVSVVTRRNDIKSLVPSFLYPNDNNIQNEPVVLKLYPLAIREIQSFSNGNNRRGRKFQAYKHKPTLKENVIEPFPTIYWLTCPILKTIISLLGHKQYIKLFEDKLLQSSLNENDNFLNEMKVAHDNYSKHRWDMLTTDDKNIVMNKGCYDSYLHVLKFY